MLKVRQQKLGWQGQRVKKDIRNREDTIDGEIFHFGKSMMQQPTFEE